MGAALSHRHISSLTLNLTSWPTFQKLCSGLWLWNQRSLNCCYLQIVAAGELCCPSDSSGWSCFFNVEIDVVSTLKIGCSTSRPKIDVKTTLCTTWVVCLPWSGLSIFEYILIQCRHNRNADTLVYFTTTWSSGGRVVKLLACGARGPGFDSRPRHLDFQRLVISCFQVEIWLKDR